MTYAGTAWKKRKGGKTERYRYNRKNQLVRRAAGGGAWDYTYDLQGNLVRETGPKGERQYLYDAENRQIRVLSGGKEIQENRYDGEGMRAGLTVNGKKSTFLYGDGDLYAEFVETGADVIRYIWGNGLAGLGYRGELYGVHRDEQLSTGWVTGGEGVPESAYEYDAFGMLLRSHGKVPSRLLYGGQQYDAEVEQYYLRARYYNPVIGRFMQEDTYRGDGLNLYAYCANDPVMYHDPSGRNADCNHATDAKKNAQQENVTKNSKTNKIKDIYDPQKINEIYSDLSTEITIPEKYKDKPEVYLNKQDSVILRDQLIASGVKEPGFPNQAHHIVPINQAIETIDHLESLGISGNSAANGVFLPSLDIDGNPQVVHSFQSSGMMRHGIEYVQSISSKILKTTTKEAALSVLNEYRKGLLDGSVTNLYIDKSGD